jgi:menaquinone-dependent protoporphyrinogen IX oxidase
MIYITHNNTRSYINDFLKEFWYSLLSTAVNVGKIDISYSLYSRVIVNLIVHVRKCHLHWLSENWKGTLK